MESSQCPLSSSNPKILRIFGSRAKPISSLHILRKKADSYTLPSMAPAEGVVENRQGCPQIGQDHDRAARSEDAAGIQASLYRDDSQVVNTRNTTALDRLNRASKSSYRPISGRILLSERSVPPIAQFALWRDRRTVLRKSQYFMPCFAVSRFLRPVHR